jgi:hypothetical protein
VPAWQCRLQSREAAPSHTSRHSTRGIRGRPLVSGLAAALFLDQRDHRLSSGIFAFGRRLPARSRAQAVSSRHMEAVRLLVATVPALAGTLNSGAVKEMERRTPPAVNPEPSEQLAVIVAGSPEVAIGHSYGIVSTTVPWRPIERQHRWPTLNYRSRPPRYGRLARNWLVSSIAASTLSVTLILTVPVRATSAAAGNLVTIGAKVPVIGL